MAQLYAAMEAAQLAELVPLAEEWCQEQGAELLEEVLEFMEDFASSLGLTVSQRERLLQQLGVEDQELLDAKQLVQQQEEEIAKLTAESKKTSKKQKGPLLARIKDLEQAPEYLSAKRFVQDPAAERERQRAELLEKLETKVRMCISDRDLPAATSALAEFRAAGGVSGNESGSLANDLAQLRAELSTKDPEEQKRRMEQRKAMKKRGFQFDPPSGAEAETEPRKMKLKVDVELGAGLQLEPSWYGMVIEEIDDEPGQDERLGPGDCICKINGQSLQEMEDCESVFIDFLKVAWAANRREYASIQAMKPCHASGAVPQSGAVDWNALEADLKSFGGDYQVDFKVQTTRFGWGWVGWIRMGDVKNAMS
ncbi:unnamed protein product [Cladocopium goreaui]|uniref:PDZ domain-containing protein n=1 Tax=Cladocopium goreaui TaxID=2562237 RepID=A0A9P1FG32_9DINO|nr:unnamed protein product [Cladocopium goreaui]